MSQYLLFLILPVLLGAAAQRHVHASFARYAAVPSGRGLAGHEVASRILQANGLAGEVGVMSAAGSLSDHYDPGERTVHLSESVFQERSVAAAAIAAHEAGHALQHAAAWRWFRVRSRLWPVAATASNAWFALLLLGAVLGATGLVTAAILLFACVVAFQLVTLPVELDASRRALAQLRALDLVDADETAGTRSVLRAAALTYVAAALASALLLLYYLGVFRR
jgi:Zn-dependent membrane protease YugP